MIRKYQVGASLPQIPQLNPAQFSMRSQMPTTLTSKTFGSTPKSGGLGASGQFNMLGNAASAISGLIPQSEQSALTTGLNQGYDAAANAIGAIPGVGTIIGGAMKIGGMLSDGLTAMGVGTDQMTTADKILDSKFLKLTPMGLINAFGAKKADTINKDTETFEQVGSSYTGTEGEVDSSVGKSGKKYGLLSGRARKKANAQIAEAKRKQNIVSGIADEASDAFANQRGSLDMLNSRNLLNMSGGYQQRGSYIGKNGLKLPSVEEMKKAQETAARIRKKSREVAEFQRGGQIDAVTGATPKVTFESWYKTVPADRNDTTSYDLKRAFELAPFEELEAWRTSSVSDLKRGKNHLNSVYLNPNTGIYEFMKSKDHPTLKYELEWYSSNDPEAVEFRNRYDLDKSGEYYKYVPKKFKEGGKMNVIPDGALHAHKHHMDIEDITPKGIAVVTVEDGGIVQHAEIERNEIIFTKEVTKELELLYKDGSDEAAIEAGKLIAKQIIENTQDNTGLISEVQV